MHTVGLVNAKYFNRGSANRSFANKSTAPPSKMLIPFVVPWMKQPNQHVRQWVKSGSVASLGAITLGTGPTHVSQ